MPNRTLYLVRHGQYERTTRPPDPPDGPLTPLGEAQAFATGERLAHLQFDALHHSDLIRARDTASILADHMPGLAKQESALLRECIPSVPEAFKEHFEQLPSDFIRNGGKQAEEAFDAYFQPLIEGEDDRRELIVAHGNLISYFVCRVIEAPLDAWINVDIQHCGICEVLILPYGRMKLARHNDIGHLPLHLQTDP